LAEYHHAVSAIASRHGITRVRPWIDFVDQETLDIGNQLACKATALRQSKFSYNEAMLENPPFILDAAPDPFVFIVSIPAGAYPCAIRLAQIKNLIPPWMKNSVESKSVVPALSPAV
jgi:hypothetical protein